MRDILYIDGIDVYEAYGISISDVAYDDLVCLPELKPIPFNDWHEKNGIEPDLSAPVIKAHSITIPMNMVGEYGDYSAFMKALSEGSYHTFNFASIGLVKSLRMVSCTEPKITGNLSGFSLILSDDDPMKGYSYSAPSSKWEQLGDYLLDGIDLAVYGIRVLRGTMASIKKNPDVKENLKRDVSVKTGVIYDGEKVTYKSRTADIRCLMRASNATEFWRNRNALVYDLTKKDERILTVTELDKDIPCYYKGCSVQCFFPDNGKYWFEFTLSLEFFKGVI